MQHIAAKSTNAKMVFDNSDNDKYRLKGQAREYIDGQPCVMDNYDHSFAYGVECVFIGNNVPEIKSYKKFIDEKFEPLKQHLKDGYDVVFARTDIMKMDHDVSRQTNNHNRKRWIYAFI